MYTPALFQENDLGRIHEIVRKFPFATMITQGAGGLIGSHLPMLLRDGGERGTIIGHMARANGQWKDLEGREALLIFHGPHAYVSPGYYVEKENVPTWNYVAVHAYGTVRTFTDPAELRSLLVELISTFEAPLARPWKLEATDAYMEPRLKAIVGFRIEVTRFEAKLKLGQNRLRQDRVAAVGALAACQDEMSREIARWMNELLA